MMRANTVNEEFRGHARTALRRIREEPDLTGGAPYCKGYLEGRKSAFEEITKLASKLSDTIEAER